MKQSQLTFHKFSHSDDDANNIKYKTPSSSCVYNQDEVVVKVDSTKEVLKKRRWVLDAVSERYTAARAGMTGKKNPAHTT